jgi:hypothetical protein
MEQHKAGYYVWLNDQRFYYPDLANAAKKSAEAMNYRSEEDNQVYDNRSRSRPCASIPYGPSIRGCLPHGSAEVVHVGRQRC